MTRSPRGVTMRSATCSSDNIGSPRLLKPIQRALHTTPALVEDVRVDHRGAYVGVPKQFLHRSNIVAGGQKMRSERVPQRVRTDGLGDPRFTRAT